MRRSNYLQDCEVQRDDGDPRDGICPLLLRYGKGIYSPPALPGYGIESKFG